MFLRKPTSPWEIQGGRFGWPDYAAARSPIHKRPWFVAAAAFAALALVVTAFMLAPRLESGKPHPTPSAIIIGAPNANAAMPSIPVTARRLLENIARGGGSVTLLNRDCGGQLHTEDRDLTPRRAGAEVEQVYVDEAITKNLAELEAAMNSWVPATRGSCLLDNLQAASERPGQLVVISHTGLDTTPPLSLDRTGLSLKPAEVVADLTRQGLLPSLDGRHVIFGLADTAGPQPPLDQASRNDLKALWGAILVAAGARVTWTWSPSSSHDPPTADLPATPTVPISPVDWFGDPFELEPARGSAGCGHRVPRQTRAVLNADVLFKPDQALFRDPAAARAHLRDLATKIEAAAAVVRLTGHTAQHDYTGLSTRRAQAVARLLQLLGVDRGRIVAVKGVGNTQPLVQPPNAPGNRAVEVRLTTNTHFKENHDD